MRVLLFVSFLLLALASARRGHSMMHLQRLKEIDLPQLFNPPKLLSHLTNLKIDNDTERASQECLDQIGHYTNNIDKKEI